MKYFVMLHHPVGYPTPLIDEEQMVAGADIEVYLYDNVRDAESAMRQHQAAQAWGYTVYPWSAE